MTKKLTKHGNSYALVIDRPILELVGINQDTELDISTDGQVLIVSPVRDAEHRSKVEAALEKVDRKYSRALKRLAQ
jgi:antitoxin component of MazEF toxin-antitoxin module